MNWKSRVPCVLALLALGCAPASAPPVSPTPETSATERECNCPCAMNHGAGAEHAHGGEHNHAGMHAAMHEGMSTSCPMNVPGTTVTQSDLPGAVALDFTTTGDVAELRRRVAEMAEHHWRHHGNPSKADDSGTTPRTHGSHGHRMMVPAEARVEETPSGARLIFTPEQPTDLDALRQHLEMRSKRMAQGQCGMMSAGAAPQASASTGPTTN